MFIRPKDYVSIDDKLFFAVVSEYQEDDRALTWLRYVKDENGMHKLNTEEAGKFICDSCPEFLFHSEYADIDLHGIPLESISKVHRPDHAVTRLLQLSSPDSIQQDALHFIKLFLNAGIKQETIGITGSVMLDTHNEQSDIDMVIYGRKRFFQVRKLIQETIQSGELKQLDETFWQDAYQRRDCSISFDEYKKHELRKFNKCISGNTKVDVSMIPENIERVEEHGPYKKTGKDKIESIIIDDTYSYDFPARYIIKHDTIKEIVSYTATYIGQAETGEQIEAAGYVEQGSDGKKRLLVGTSREAEGEYIRLINK
jgi:predicted nucleotidyltransferase